MNRTSLLVILLCGLHISHSAAGILCLTRSDKRSIEILIQQKDLADLRVMQQKILNDYQKQIIPVKQNWLLRTFGFLGSAVGVGTILASSEDNCVNDELGWLTPIVSYGACGLIAILICYDQNKMLEQKYTLELIKTRVTQQLTEREEV